MTVVLLFFFLGFCLCSPLTMCLFRLKAELNVLEHSFHKYLSDTLTLFSLTKMPKPAADFTFLTWFSCDDFFSCVFTCLSIQTFIWILFHIFHNPETFSPCQAFLRAPACCVWWPVTWLVCTFVRTLFTFVLSFQVLTAGLNIVTQIQVWHHFRIGLYLV